MRKRFLAALLALILVTLCAPALANVEEVPALDYPTMPADEAVLIGGSEGDSVRDTFGDGDAIYISCRYNSNDGSFEGLNPTLNTQTAILRLDASAQLVWRYVYDLQKGHNDFGYLSKQPDGTLLTGFQWWGDNVSSYDMIFRWDTDGNLLSKFELDVGEMVVYENGDGYFLVDNNQGGPKILHRYDAQGTLLWTREYPELANCGFFIARVEDGFLLVGGKSQPNQTGPNDHAATKLSLDGELLWQTLCGRSDFGGFQRFTVLPDGGLFAVGDWYQQSEDANGMMDNVRGYAARFSADGALLWESTTDFGYKTDFEGVAQVPGGYLVAGRINKRLCYVLYGEDGTQKGVWQSDSAWRHSMPFLVTCAGSTYVVSTVRENPDADTNIYVQRLRLEELQ